MPEISFGPLDQITEDTLNIAIVAGLYEGQSLDFKRDCYGTADADKKELLRDVVAMTNGGGGMLLVGIDEDQNNEGKASAITPVADETERLRASCLTGIADRIPGLAFHKVEVSGGYVLVIRCPRSFRGPHMVAFSGENRFWIRHGKQKDRMSVREIRDAFEQSRTFERNIRTWLNEQRSQLRNRTGAWLHATIAPYGPQEDVLDVTDIEVRRLLNNPPQVENYFGWVREQARPTLSGLYVWGEWGDKNRWEVELLRNGTVKLTAYLPPYSDKARDIGVYTTIQALAKYPVSLARLASGLYSYLGLQGGFVLALDLFVNVDQQQLDQMHHSFKDYLERLPPRDPSFVPREAIVPESVIPNLDEPDKAFREMLDKLWNAFGEDTCPYTCFEPAS